MGARTPAAVLAAIAAVAAIALLADATSSASRTGVGVSPVARAAEGDARLRIDWPANGTVRRHYVSVVGAVLGADLRRLSVEIDGRGAETYPALGRDGSFRGILPLRMGTNRVRVRVLREVDDDAPEGQEETVLAERNVTVTRARPRPSPLDGTLDRATAWFVARETLYLCGEGGDCYSQPHCVRVSRVRVDCPSTVHFDEEPVGVCGTVVSVQRERDGRVLYGEYRCQGVPVPAGTARRFVQPWQEVARRRFTGEGDLDATPHGIPHFDVLTNRLAR